jgi:hypothetical protein
MPGAADLTGRRDYPEPSQPSDQSAPPPGTGRSAADQHTGRDDLDRQPDQAVGHSPGRLRQRLDNLPDGHPSSPRNEDGSWRSPAVNLKDLELPIEDTPSEAETSPDSEDQAQAPDTASNTWRDGLPALQAAWDRHLERWPETDRPPVDRSGDEPGSWRGDGGQYLNTEENIVTEHALDRVSKTEDSVTASVKDVEATVPGAALVGLEYSLKGEDRFKEKVSYEARAKPEKSIDQITNDLPDAIRYTYQFDASSYTDGYSKTCDKLQQHGYVMEFSRNSWENPQYRGVNTRWREPAGQLFEVQFHTPESFNAKQLTHLAYERIRNPGTSDLERDDLHEFQEKASTIVPLPEGALSIPDYRKKEIDGN